MQALQDREEVVAVAYIDILNLQWKVKSASTLQEGKWFLAFSAILLSVMFAGLFIGMYQVFWLLPILVICLGRGCNFYFFAKKALGELDGVAACVALTNSAIYVNKYFPENGEVEVIPIDVIEDLVCVRAFIGYELAAFVGKDRKILTSFVKQSSALEMLEKFLELKKSRIE